MAASVAAGFDREPAPAVHHRAVKVVSPTSPASRKQTVHRTGGFPVQSFAWTLGGRTFAVHVAVGPAVTETNVRAADHALGGFAVGN